MRKTNTYTISITIDIERGNSYHIHKVNSITSIVFCIFIHIEGKRTEGYNNITKREKKRTFFSSLLLYPNPALEFLTTCVTG